MNIVVTAKLRELSLQNRKRYQIIYWLMTQPYNLYSSQILILIPCILEYVENNQQNALNSILPYFLFSRWLLHVSAKQCHPQGATMFLSEPLQRQYGRRQIILPMTCLLPYWRWSGSERNMVAPWGWQCFAETRRSHREKKKLRSIEFSEFCWLFSTSSQIITNVFI
jgi:hypothetical protein